MARPTRLTVAKKDIFAHFAASSQRVYSQAQLSGMLAEQRSFWRLAERTSVFDFIEFLTHQGDLRAHQFHAPNYGREIVRFSWGQASIYELTLSLNSRGFLSHATAVALHALTDLVPKTLYLNVEQSPKPAPRGSLTQKGIDQAFSRNQRQSNLSYEHDGWAITIINGKQTERLGVEDVTGPSAESLQVTNLERTLIDIAVRPAYSGGIFQVLEAYRAAIDRVSVNRLVATLKKLNYVYPYHQAIGFLMQRAGYDEKRFSMLRQPGIAYNFYLVHGIQEPEYDAGWQLFYPKGLQV